MHNANVASSSGPLPGGDRSPLLWQRVETLGVAEVVMAILQARKAMPWATAAKVSRVRQGDAIRVCVSLWETSPQPPVGGREVRGGTSGAGEVIAAFLARQLSGDLAGAFGDHDIITLR